MNQVKYSIGIDLGTTNCTMACVLIQEGNHPLRPVEQVSILQTLSAQTPGCSFSLPSFIYYPLSEEIKSQAAELPWSSHQPFSIGTYARDRGAELPSRLIHSAKSWLCHPGIDRREKLLPPEADEKGNRMSPLEACAEILRHLRLSWDAAHPEAPFEKQEILITVPASFDPSARQLVQEAAESVGFPGIVLLEEPSAAFYAWLHLHAETWRQQLKVGDAVLVIDIGGGTTDFSLISVEEDEGNLQLRRLAVGSHLLLGGDNVDLGLAYIAKQKLEEQGHPLDQWQLQGLIHQCRNAKEQLLGDHPPESIDITLLGRGSRLIGGSVKTQLSAEEARRLILEGFIPLVKPEEISPAERHAGIKQMGLPYVQDPRISCQLAKFFVYDRRV